MKENFNVLIASYATLVTLQRRL